MALPAGQDELEYESEFRIEEFDLDAFSESLKGFSIYMSQEGLVFKIERVAEDASSDFSFVYYYKPNDSLRVRSIGEDETAAVKAANEIRVRILALGLWGDSEKAREAIYGQRETEVKP